MLHFDFLVGCLVEVNPGKSAADTFMQNGFRDWKYATGHSGMLLQHDKCSSHKQSMLMWHECTKNAVPRMVKRVSQSN